MKVWQDHPLPTRMAATLEQRHIHFRRLLPQGEKSRLCEGFETAQNPTQPSGNQRDFHFDHRKALTSIFALTWPSFKTRVPEGNKRKEPTSESNYIIGELGSDLGKLGSVAYFVTSSASSDGRNDNYT